MAANWRALARHLSTQGERVELSWPEFDALVGGVPESALNHVPWWSGDRPHTRAWRAAGFELESREPGVSVTFVRTGGGGVPDSRPMQTLVAHGAATAVTADRLADRGRVVLVSCSKTKRDKPSAAKDLYSSTRFSKARRYAEGAGVPWFILSAEHGLVSPDEWLAPYDRYLPDTPRAYRRVWGEWVVARLSLLLNGLGGRTIEIHAGRQYVGPLHGPLRAAGATIQLPLAGLSLGSQLQWYGRVGSTDRSHLFAGDVEPVWRRLADESVATSASNGRLLSRTELAGPGLYAWFVDDSGAADLARGLGEPVAPGLIYVGQTGATKWPTGTRSASTLRTRILGQHLGRRRSASTLRRTLGAVLDETRGRILGPPELTDWMREHLSVVLLRLDDGDVIGDLERRVVHRLDPPLNLDHVSTSPLRVRLKALRAGAAGRE
ncbi:DUF6884 domain-containing protein [Nocardioides coralli]|uniref:DUF6884 domain-containing protein n=1 Tax=Nocardioides coralli TaxID=2872154 RepID=UPI001CA44182|nr:DUF6884 domain-containing protein [Nocardioides coralli]QZY29698.1 hypothetical protein K6T13_03115 [Nocardioides coralli]